MLLCYTGGIASAPPPHARFESGHGAWPSVRVETASYPHGRTRCFSPRHSAHSPFFSPARAHRPLPQPTRPFHSSCSHVPPLPAQCKPVAHPVLLINGYPSASLAHHLFTCSGGKIAASKIKEHVSSAYSTVCSISDQRYIIPRSLALVSHFFQKEEENVQINDKIPYVPFCVLDFICACGGAQAAARSSCMGVWSWVMLMVSGNSQLVYSRITTNLVQRG